MLDLWAYQIDLLDQIICNIDKGSKSILLASPTGSGKSIIFCCLIGILKPRTCLIVVPTTELKKQHIDLLRANGITNVEVETIQKLVVSPSTTVDLLLLDETHHYASTIWGQIFNLIKYTTVVGFTATPFRTDFQPLLAKNGGPFETYISGPSISELTNEGYLAKIVYRTVPLVQQLNKLPLYMFGKVVSYIYSFYYAIDDKSDQVVDGYKKDYNDMSALVFCKNIAHVDKVAQDFIAGGIAAAPIHSYLSKAQKRATISQFRDKKIKVLATCNMLNEGFDMSNAKLAILLKRVNSLGLFLQELGRILRAEGSQPAVVWDLVGNVYQHGKIENISIDKLAR